MQNAAESTFGMVTGKFDFDSMVMAAPLLGPIVFFIFVLVATIVLVNIFLTLIISAFETVKHDVMKQDNEYEIVDFMKKKLKNMLGIYNFVHETNEVVDEKEKQQKMFQEQITILPTKIDHMLHFMNKKANGKVPSVTVKPDQKRSTHFDSFAVNEQANKIIAGGRVNKNGRRKLSRMNHENDASSQNLSPQITFLNWNEIVDDN